jgi:hypothetical protein
MAITVSVNSHVRMGKKRAMFGTLLLDSSYATGGYLIPLATIGFLRAVEEAQVHMDGYDVQFDAANQRLVIYEDVLLLVDGAVADGAATRINAAVAGTLGANTGANISQPSTREVPNGTNLSAHIAVPFWFLGY